MKCNLYKSSLLGLLLVPGEQFKTAFVCKISWDFHGFSLNTARITRPAVNCLPYILKSELNISCLLVILWKTYESMFIKEILSSNLVN